MNRSSKIYIAGHNGMVGSSIWRLLESKGYHNLIGKKSSELDLRDSVAVDAFYDLEKPEYVFLAAAKVGGIHANNTYKAEFMYDNLMIEANLIHSSFKHGVKKLLFLGSSCIYPKDAKQPLKEEYLLTGPLESTNEAYAIAKIAGIKMCEYYREQYGCNFISAMPTNLFGFNDNYDLNNSHVLPALIRKFHEARINKDETVTAWGTGNPLREFLFVDDLAEACLFLMENYNEKIFVNIGTGIDLTIRELTETVANQVGFEGKVLWDSTKPDGTPRKLMDVSRINALGWECKTSLKEGIAETYDDFINNYNRYTRD